MPVVIGGHNLPSPVGIGLTDLPGIGRASGPPGPPGSGITVVSVGEENRKDVSDRDESIAFIFHSFLLSLKTALHI